MALIGGGGAGNVAGGANPAGVGTALNYIGDHAYAYSGSITDASSGSAATTLLKFNTGSSYLLAKLTILTDEASTAAIFIEGFLNGEKIIDIVSDNTSVNNPLITPYELLIPSYSEFEFKAGANSSVDFTAFIVGRVHS